MPDPQQKHRLVVIASSAGGLRALRALLAELPQTFPLPILVVQHIAPTRETQIATILSRITKLAVRQAKCGDRAEAGVVLVAPPDRHMLLEAGGVVHLTDSPAVQFVRPSANVLFESAARVVGRGTIAVVLSGSGHDATRGAKLVKEAGGTIVIQSEAEFESMPRSALAALEKLGQSKDAIVCPLTEIPRRLMELAEGANQ